MTRWDTQRNADVETPAIDAFLEVVIAVCRKHGFSISHEDGHGAFIVNEFIESDADWLREAHVDPRRQNIGER